MKAWIVGLLGVFLVGCGSTLPTEEISETSQNNALLGKILYLKPSHQIRICDSAGRAYGYGDNCKTVTAGKIIVTKVGANEYTGRKFFFVESDDGQARGWVEAVWIAGPNERLNGAVSPYDLSGGVVAPLASSSQTEPPALGMLWFDVIGKSWGMPDTVDQVKTDSCDAEVWGYGSKSLYLCQGEVSSISYSAEETEN